MTDNKRQKILDNLEQLLKDISVANGYQTNFAKVEAWDETPAEYRQNVIIYRDQVEKYKKENIYTATLRVEIQAIVLETAQKKAGELGNIALIDLINAVSKLSVCKSIVTLVESYKWIETKGITAAQVELSIDVKYQSRYGSSTR